MSDGVELLFIKTCLAMFLVVACAVLLMKAMTNLAQEG